jgi:hypothetical protein
MKKLIVTVALAVLALPVLACPDDTKSVQYFVAHPKEITPTLKQCSQKACAPNCKAASEADAQLHAIALEAQTRNAWASMYEKQVQQSAPIQSGELK